MLILITRNMLIGGDSRAIKQSPAFDFRQMVGKDQVISLNSGWGSSRNCQGFLELWWIDFPHDGFYILPLPKLLSRRHYNDH